MILVSPNIIKDPSISIVIITYNQEKTISKAIENVLNQKCSSSFEIIICEDKGIDETRNICIDFQNKYSKIIKLILQDYNKGIIANYADGLSLCNGKYIAQCSGDDYWIDPLKLQKQFDYLESNPDFGFVRTNGYRYYEKKNKFKVCTYHDHSEGYIFEKAKYGPVALASSIFFNKDLLKYIDFNEFLKRNFSMEDYPMHAIFSKYTKFGYIPDLSIVYRVTKDSASNPQSIDRLLKYNQGYFNVKRYLHELFPKDTEFDEIKARNHMEYIKLRIAYKNWNFKQAKTISSKFQSNYKQKLLVILAKYFITFYTLAFLKFLHSKIFN